MKPKPNITVANHKGHIQSNEPIKTLSNYMWVTQSMGKHVRVNPDWFWFYSLWDEKVAQVFLNQSGGIVSAIPIRKSLFNTQMKTALGSKCLKFT